LFEHGSGFRDQGLLSQALAEPAITDAFDLVILDTPPSLDILLLNALRAAHGVIVPYVPHPLSLEGVKQLMRVLFMIKSGENPDLKIYGLLPVMVAEHIREHRAITGEIEHQFGAPKVLAGIRTDIKLAESFGTGQPIRIYAPKSRAAEDFAALGRTLAGVCEGRAYQ
jgi:chromosome partitioning protein